AEVDQAIDVLRVDTHDHRKATLGLFDRAQVLQAVAEVVPALRAFGSVLGGGLKRPGRLLTIANRVVGTTEAVPGVGRRRIYLEGSLETLQRVREVLRLGVRQAFIDPVLSGGVHELSLGMSFFGSVSLHAIDSSFRGNPRNDESTHLMTA